MSKNGDFLNTNIYEPIDYADLILLFRDVIGGVLFTLIELDVDMVFLFIGVTLFIVLWGLL